MGVQVRLRVWNSSLRLKTGPKSFLKGRKLEAGEDTEYTKTLQRDLNFFKLRQERPVLHENLNLKRRCSQVFVVAGESCKAGENR